MTDNEIKFASNYIANIALEDNGAEKVNIAIQSLLSTYLKEALNVPKNNDFKPLSTIITFTQKEISHMVKNLKRRKKEEIGCFFLTYTELAVHRWCHFQASLYRLHP